MLAIQIIRAKGLPVKEDYFTTVSFCGEEIFRTEGCNRESNGDPVWQDADEFSLDEFNGKEEENKRPLFLEKISIQVYAQRGDRKSELVGEARIPLFNIGPPQWYKLVPKAEGISWDAQILTTLSFPQSSLQEFSSISFLPFCEVLDISNVQYSPLFINMGESSLSLFGANPLPGPTCGEILLDYHGCVEVDMSTGVNLFKDKCTVKCTGSLFLTDLRLVFIPDMLSPSPPGFLGVPQVAEGECCMSEENLLAIRRMTLQFPISGIQDIKCQSSSKDSSSLRVVCRNSMCTEFLVKSGGREQRGPATPLEEKLGAKFYTGGLLSRDMPPQLWCSRLTEELLWMIREDLVWLRWAEYLGLTVHSLLSASSSTHTNTRRRSSGTNGFVFREFAATPQEVTKNSGGRRSSLKEVTDKFKTIFLNKFHPCVERLVNVPVSRNDYIRMGLQADPSWKISALNEQHQLCATYPEVLVFPSALSDEEIRGASLTRSKARLPSMVWLHPVSRAPLCRCAQPLAGISGVYVTEPDVKMCLAIRAAASPDDSKQLRILDCRPKINAHANAIQGKGFENVASLGGADGATLVFADIHNIHVMRESLQKVRDTNGNTDSDEGGGGGNSSPISKWLHHVAAVLRGAAAAAESLLLGYPVLVHCSDGWDRTAQISALAQLLLDPYYRTIEGFLMLIEKEWIGFGFQFQERLGRMTDKGTSPVFTQYLDCVWQLLNQYPTQFEFSSGMLEVIIMCAYSGLFSSFRHDCERQRVEELTLHAESTLNTSFSVVHFSSIFTYVHLLLSTGMAALLVNPKFQRPDSSVKYLHPRFGVEDLTLWVQGLLPRGFSSFSQGGGRTVLSRVECDALASSAHTGLLRQWTAVARRLPLGLGLGSALDLVSGGHHGSLLAMQRPHESAFKADLRSYGQVMWDISVYRQVDDDHFFSSAVIRVQVWYRARRAMRSVVMENNVDISSGAVRKLSGLLLALCCRAQWKACMSAYVMKKHMITSIIDDVVAFVVVTCDDLQRLCPDLICYEEGTTRGTLLLDTNSDCNAEGGDEDETSKSRSTSRGSEAPKNKPPKSSMKTNFFSKISKGFNTNSSKKNK